MQPTRKLAILITVAIGCSSSTDGPKPTITSVMPTPICDAQHAIMVTITGSGFSPIVKDGLTSHPAVVMPRVVLQGTGGDVEIDPANISLPDNTGTTLIVSVPMSSVQPGVYGVEVIDPDGHDATLANGLTVDPPPHITSIMPTQGAVGSTVQVTLTGTGFRAGMTVTLESNPPVVGTMVAVNADGTSATVSFDLTGVAAGTYDITVDNGDGCTDTLAASFTVYVPHDLMLTGIDPPFGCMCSPTSVTISSNGGFVSTPRVEMRPHGQTMPVIVMDRVAFVDTSTLTAVVPANLDLGDYDVTVINPPSDGGIGTMPSAFRVVSLPPPTIDAIVPSRGDPTVAAGTPVSIYGENFRNPVKVELLDTTLTVRATVASVAPVSATQIDTTLPTNGMTDGAYLVRVTDLDQGTYSTFSSFIVGQIGAAGNLHTFAAETTLTTGRRMLTGVSARDDLGNTFVYAIGGDTGGATPAALASVEVAQLSKFGALGAWHQEPASNAMTTPRDAPAAVSVPLYDPAGSPFVPIKTYVYALGGRDSGAATGTVLGSIERAMVLRNADAPVVTSIASSTMTGTLATGTWYYKVSAVLANTDPDNPGGETLPSDEQILTIGAGTTSIDLAWNAVTVNGTAAVKYRVYRTAMVDGVSQQEKQIAEVTGTSYTDTGDVATTVEPLPAGALGVWVAQTQTVSPRWGHQAAIVTDKTGARFVYVLGGKSDSAAGYLTSIERSAVDTAGALGTFASGGQTALGTGLAFFSLAVETHENVSTFPGTTSGDVPARFVTTGGVTAAGASTELQESDVATGGNNGAWTAYAGAGTLSTRGGPMAVITGNKLFCLGGAGAATDTTFSQIKQTGVDLAFSSTGDFSSPIQSTANALPAPRALGAVVNGSGFIYFLGGTSDGTNATTTSYETF